MLRTASSSEVKLFDCKCGGAEVVYEIAGFGGAWSCVVDCGGT